MINIAVCDDDLGCCNKIEKWIFDCFSENEIQLHSYYTTEDLTRDMKMGVKYNLIILDVLFTQSSGIEAAKYIRETLRDEDVFIIFISGKTHFCMELFEMEPLNFHVKPLDSNKLLADISKVLRRVDGMQKKIKVYSTKGKSLEVCINEICYIEAQRRNTIIYTKQNAKVLVKCSFAQMLEMIKFESVCQCHRSYCVNLKYAETFTRHNLTMKNGDIIPIGRSFLENIKSKWDL